MKKSRIAAMVAVLALSHNQAHAFGSAAESPLLYFEMGGGEPVREPLITTELLSVELNAGFKTISACDLWDIKHLENPIETFTDMVKDHVEGTMDQLGQQILINITAMAQGLLASAVQRAMPGMYDYGQNVHAQLDVKLDVAKKSCESVVASVQGGTSPFSDWKNASTAEAWKEALGVSISATGEVTTSAVGTQPNIIRAQDAVARNEGNSSIEWFGGKKGGNGAEPIELIKDSVGAGYALQAGKNTTAVATTAAGSVTYQRPDGTTIDRENRLGQLWASSADAQEWAKKVIGERIVSYCSNCDGSEFQAGTGLLGSYYDEREKIVANWKTVLAKTTPPTIAEMNSVSGGNVHLTRHVYDALMDMIPQERLVYAERLAADAAISATAEKAMALRRILKSAITTPEVRAYDHVKKELDMVQADLKTELEELKWELDLQKALSSHSAAELVSYHQAKQDRSRSIPLGTANSPAQDRTILGPKPELRE